MNGIEAIKERILQEAKQEADRVIQEAEKKAAVILEKKAAKANGMKEKRLKEYDAQALELKRRMVSVAGLDMRKKVLTVKQEMIDKAFETCIKSIKSMPGDKYRQMLEELLVSATLTGTEEVIFSKHDGHRLNDELLNKVNQNLISAGKSGQLKPSDQKGDFLGGFILKAGGMELNHTFESVLRVVRDEIEPQVARILF